MTFNPLFIETVEDIKAFAREMGLTFNPLFIELISTLDVMLATVDTFNPLFIELKD